MSAIDDLVEELPVDLRIAIAATLEDPSLDCGPPEARALMASKYKKGPSVSLSNIGELRSSIISWIERQEQLQAQADLIVEELWEKFKPEANSIPVWFTQRWAFHLRSPWSAALETSVAQAREWINGNAG